MKTIHNTKIIGIDHGYGNMKTANCCFPTGITAYDHEPLFTADMLVYGGRYYLIGEGHKEFAPDKIKDEDYYVLTLAAIAKELKTENLTEAHIVIAAGLPLTWTSGQKADFRAYLMKNAEVEFVYKKTAYHIYIDDVRIYPQGYTGCMVNLKTTTVSYKVHKLIRKPEEEWSIVPNAQEAIIDENTWLRVQELRKNKRRPTATGKTSLFSGLVFCADCGSKLHFCAAKSLKANQEFFRCANYKSGRGECTIHYIRNVALEQIVSVAVSDLADFVTCHESFFLQMVGKRQSAGKDRNIRSVKSDIVAGKHRIDEIDRLIAKLYEDNFAGKLSDERYSRMAAKYEKEQAELLQSVSTKEKELTELERESVDIRLLLAGLREYSSMETLTPEVVNKIIKRIEVHNSEMLNGHKRVGIDIYFTGVGLVDLATIKEMLAIAESSRP